jgi:hypothetical protein
MLENREGRPNSRVLDRYALVAFKRAVFDQARAERPEEVSANELAVETFINRGSDLIQELERVASPHPKVHLDTDVVYIDSGPGPYDYSMLPPGKIELEDTNYHKWSWSRQMDRARTRVAYQLAASITAGRIQDRTRKVVLPRDLSEQDFSQDGPYLMYTSTDWQNAHIRDVHAQLTDAGLFKIPESKLIMYEEFTSRTRERKKITHTEDQIEGLRFPHRPDGQPPRRVSIVSHPAHLMRIFHILGKYPDSIPDGTIVQPFPVPTPTKDNGVTEYAKAELLGTLATILKKGRATFEPYDRYQL